MERRNIFLSLSSSLSVCMYVSLPVSFLSLSLTFSSFAIEGRIRFRNNGLKILQPIVQRLTTVYNAQNVTGCFAAFPSWFVNNRKLALLSTVDQLHVKINAKNLEGNSSRPRVALI